jgi:hypothetical protein
MFETVHMQLYFIRNLQECLGPISLPDFTCPALNNLLFIPLRQKAKYRFHAAAILLSYILQYYYFNRSFIIFEPILSYTISRPLIK